MKDKILQALKENSPGFVSGASLSEMLNVSRTAVWKYVLELRKEGYIIESSPKKGYKLISTSDLLNLHELSYGLKAKKIGSSIKYLDIVDSTNTYAKRLAQEGCPEGTVVVAERQTGGKGRLGRTWESIGNSNIYMSIVLKPSMAPEQVQIITLAAAVAVIRAIKSTTGIKAGIKWPNDVILDGKKVCGILTEMSSEMDRINFVVVGIGINVNQDEKDFPEELKVKATSLKAFINKTKQQETRPYFKRSDIIKEVIYEMEQQYEKINNSRVSEIIEEWKRHSVTIGKEVKVISRNIEYVGIAEGVTEDGRLVVKCNDGVRKEILSGEVSIRGAMGYI